MSDSDNVCSPPTATMFYKRLLDSLFDAVYTVDLDGKVTYWNPSCQRLTGYAPEEVLGRRYEELAIAYVSAEGESAQQRRGTYMAMDSGMPGTWKGYIRRKNGQRIPILSHISPVQNDQGQTIGAVEVFRDISAQVALEQAHKDTLNISRKDQLTGLNNRPAISELIDAEIERSRRYRQNLSVIMVDIDHFKRFNDRYGHDAGDRVLTKVGEILSHNLRQPDAVGRWGGEEFLILAPGSDRLAAGHLAQRIRQYIQQVELAGIDETVTASFGVSELQKGMNRDNLIYVADMALYKAKEAGRNRVVIGDAAELRVCEQNPTNHAPASCQ